MYVRLWGATVAAALIAAVPTQAQVAFQYANSTGTLGTAYTIPAVNGTVQIQVYLTDTGTTLSTQGVQNSGFRVTSSNPNVARVNATAGVVGNIGAAGFTQNATGFPVVNTATGIADVQLISFTGGGVPVPATPPLSRLLIATLTFTGIGPGSTTLTFSDSQAGSSNNTTGTGTNLDGIAGLFAQTATIVVPVPEPTSLLLAGVGIAGLAALRRRKKVAVP